ncbi:MAG: DUF2267 domain-containing protein [Myxococcaceae bacterium]
MSEQRRAGGQAGGIETGARREQTWVHFLKLLQARGGLTRQLAENAAVSVMCALEQHLAGGEAEDMEAQLPLRLRELLQRCPIHQGTPAKRFGRDEFLDMVASELGVEAEEAEHLTHAVFETVRDWLSEGEVEDVASQLPDDLRGLWAATV